MGPMVLGVCRRILRDPSEADDAFQATFLVLARKAGSIRTGDSLGPWLHGVSRRVARRLQSVAARRPASATEGEGPGSLLDRHQGVPEDVERRLDLEDALKALPADFRHAIWLCYYDGLTHEEAAVKLGCPVGTIRSRLVRGRALLRQRLETRSGTGPAHLVVGSSLIDSTARAAARLAAGHPVAGVGAGAGHRGRNRSHSSHGQDEMDRRRGRDRDRDAGRMGGLGRTVRPGAGASGGSQREIDSPPSDRLRGDFGRPLQKRVLSPRKKHDDKPAAELPADFPAFVVETQPKLGDVDVDPATVKEIRVTFSKPMMDKSWSWTQGNVYPVPREHRTGPLPGRQADVRDAREAGAGQDVRDRHQWRPLQ